MALPKFVIVGAQRCGTTAIAGMLRRHPRIHMPGQEPHFFDNRYAEGLGWYRKHFVNGKVNGEKSPRYVARPDALIRLARTLPGAKVIFVVRDPTIRFGSACRHWNGVIKSKQYVGVVPFLQRAAGIDALWRGVYWNQLDLLWSLFPKDNVLVVFNSELRAHTETQMEVIQEFIGVEPVALTCRAPAERGFPNVKLESEIRKWYKPHNKLLYERLASHPILNWSETRT